MSKQFDKPKQPRKVVIHFTLGALILVGFAAFIQAFIGWSSLLTPWKNLSLAPLVAAIILVFLTYGLRAFRVYDYFRPQISGQFVLCLHLSLQHNMMNNLLPMRTGELSFPVLISRYFAIPAKQSIPTLLWFRLLDLHSLALLALLITGHEIIGLTPTLVITALWLILPWAGYHLCRSWLNKIENRSGRAWTILQHTLQSFPQTPARFWRSWLWTLLNWILKLAVFAWVLGLFVETSFAAAWLGAIGGDLTSVLPIHGIAGAGTYEAGVVAGLIPFGISPAEALVAAVNLHLFVLGCTIVSGLASLILPKKIAEKAAAG